MDPLFLAYLSLTAALVIAPGATTAVVVRNTLASGSRGGIAAAVGAAIGNSTHAAAAGLGLALALARFPPLLTGIQAAGGLYLAWLGVASARRVVQGHAVPVSAALLADRAETGHRHAIREGIMVNLLNPAIATFYLTVVPAFLPTPVPRGSYVQLAAVHVVMAFTCHCAWALSLARLRHIITRPAARSVLEAVTASALLLLAGRVLSDALASL
jgi:threonine/homoserine/homoserine lactone efflux protein